MPDNGAAKAKDGQPHNDKADVKPLNTPVLQPRAEAGTINPPLRKRASTPPIASQSSSSSATVLLTQATSTTVKTQSSLAPEKPAKQPCTHQATQTRLSRVQPPQVQRSQGQTYPNPPPISLLNYQPYREDVFYAAVDGLVVLGRPPNLPLRPGTNETPLGEIPWDPPQHIPRENALGDIVTNSSGGRRGGVGRGPGGESDGKNGNDGKKKLQEGA